MKLTQLLEKRVLEIGKVLIAHGLERSDMQYYSMSGTSVCQIWYDFKGLRSYVVEIMEQSFFIAERVSYTTAVIPLQNALQTAGF